MPRGGRTPSGCSSWGVCPAPSMIARRAPGMPAATCSARGRPTASSAPAITSVGAVDAREAVVERLHRALACGPQLGGEAPRIVREAHGADAGGAHRRERRLAGEDRVALPARPRTCRSRPARSAPRGPRRHDGVLHGHPGRRCLADGLSRTRRATTFGVGHGKAQPDPGAEASSRGRPPARRRAAGGRQRASSAVALDGRGGGVARCVAAMARQVRGEDPAAADGTNARDARPRPRRCR